MAVTHIDIRAAVKAIGLSGHPVCVHASLRSFGWVEGGAETVIQSLLAEGCTVLTFTLSFAFASPPPPGRHPAQNGMDYEACADQLINVGPVYSPDTQEIERERVGSIPTTLLAIQGRARGNHPRDSFAAVGPLANRLISGQSPLNVYAPLRTLAKNEGFVALMGVGLNKMTLIHLAEQQAGRRSFRCWANSTDEQPIEVEEGGCSDGFIGLEPILSTLMTTIQVGQSLWRVFPAQAALDAAAEAIRRNPMITHCGNPTCAECRDAVLGGPWVS